MISCKIIPFRAITSKVASNTNPTKSGSELRSFGRVGSSCSASDTRRVILVTNLVISHERPGSVYDKWNISQILLHKNRLVKTVKHV
jgi:hypothetical protein